MSDKDKQDLSVSSSPDPFKNDDNRVESWRDQGGQSNQKIVDGPDKGVHRYYDPKKNRSGQTGIIRKDGKRSK